VPWAVIGAGIVYTLWLVSFISDEVFYVGDLGLRALLTHQMAAGHLAFHLDPPAEAWVRELWDAGLFPFEPGFVYEQRGRRYLVYPAIFSLLTAPFYAFMGFRGLYVVPLLALWATWVRFAAASRHAGLRGGWAAVGLAALVFASPLTPYGAMYWDHTLAIFLAFTGLTLLVPVGGTVTRRGAVLGGLLLALSGLFREELFCLVGLLVLMVLASPWLPPVRALGFDRQRTAALASIGAGLAFSLATNWLMYGNPLGMHAMVGIEHLSARPHLAFALHLASFLVVEFFRYFPPAAFAALLVLVPWLARHAEVPMGAWLWLALSAGFLLGTISVLPWEGGKQWGPRYVYVLVPITALLAVLALAALRSSTRAVRIAVMGAFSVLCALGAWRNVYQGSSDLRRNYQRRAVALARLRSLEPKTIAVSHQFIAQQMAALFDHKRLFLTPTGRSLRVLAQALSANGEARFTFVCDPVYPCGPVTEATETIALPHGRPPVLRLTRSGAVDRYLLYDGEVLSTTPSPDTPSASSRN
jgi:hypothetical protein